MRGSDAAIPDERNISAAVGMSCFHVPAIRGIPEDEATSLFLAEWRSVMDEAWGWFMAVEGDDRGV